MVQFKSRAMPFMLVAVSAISLFGGYVTGK